MSNVLSLFKDASGNGSVRNIKIRTQLELPQPLNTQRHFERSTVDGRLSGGGGEV
jgi:hypothetical protein